MNQSVVPLSYDVLIQSLAREVQRISDRQIRAEVIATLYLAGLHADRYHSPEDRKLYSD